VDKKREERSPGAVPEVEGFLIRLYDALFEVLTLGWLMRNA